MRAAGLALLMVAAAAVAQDAAPTGLLPPPPPGPAPGVVTTLPRPAETNPLPDGPVGLPPPSRFPAAATDDGFLEPAGRFERLEIGILKPHVKNGVRVPLTFLGDAVADVPLPQPELDVAGSIKYLSGYHLPDGFGAFAYSYRHFASTGEDRITGSDFIDLLRIRTRSRLDVNVVDLQYLSDRTLVTRSTAFSWELGVRLASLYTDNRVESDGLFGLRTTNHALGAGPQVALGLDQQVGATGFTLFGKVDGAVIVSRIKQRAMASLGDLNKPTEYADSDQDGSQAVPHVNVQAGLNYQTPVLPRLRFSGGYQWEQFWNTASIFDSRGDLRTQGGFLRGELRY